MTIPVIIRPVGSNCQLACVDCYTHSGSNPANLPMDLDLLGQVVRQVASLPPEFDRVFGFHGGEPLLATPAWYNAFHYLLARHGIRRPRLFLQTNGQALSPTWLPILGDPAHPYAVGISYNGSSSILRPENPDRRRRILQFASAAADTPIELSVLCVVDQGNVQEPLQTLDDCADIAPRVTFLPARRTRYAPHPESYRAFLRYVCQHRDDVTIGNLENAALQWHGIQSDCEIAPTCQNHVIVDRNGDFYSCEWFMTPDRRRGNVATHSIRDVVECDATADLRGAYWAPRPECAPCAMRPACYGGCPVDVENGKNAHCASRFWLAEETRPDASDLHRRPSPPRE